MLHIFTNRVFLKTLSVLLFAVAALVVVSLLFVFFSYTLFGKATKATVTCSTSAEYRAGSYDDHYYTTTVRQRYAFTAQNGREYTFTEEFSSMMASAFARKEGTQVTAFYRASDPHSAKTLAALLNQTGICALVALGAFWAAKKLLSLANRKREEPHTAEEPTTPSGFA